MEGFGSAGMSRSCPWLQVRLYLLKLLQSCTLECPTSVGGVWIQEPDQNAAQNTGAAWAGGACGFAGGLEQFRRGQRGEVAVKNVHWGCKTPPICINMRISTLTAQWNVSGNGFCSVLKSWGGVEGYEHSTCDGICAVSPFSQAALQFIPAPSRHNPCTVSVSEGVAGDPR